MTFRRKMGGCRFFLHRARGLKRSWPSLGMPSSRRVCLRLRSSHGILTDLEVPLLPSSSYGWREWADMSEAMTLSWLQLGAVTRRCHYAATSTPIPAFATRALFGRRSSCTAMNGDSPRSDMASLGSQS